MASVNLVNLRGHLEVRRGTTGWNVGEIFPPQLNRGFGTVLCSIYCLKN